MNEEVFREMGKELQIRREDLKMYSPLVLAYVGDAVFELYIRTLLVGKGNAPVHKLHKRPLNYGRQNHNDTIHRMLGLVSRGAEWCAQGQECQVRYYS